MSEAGGSDGANGISSSSTGAAEDAGAAFLASAKIRSCLGHGSNASVLCVQFDAATGSDPFPTVPRNRKVAVKLMSHFWDPHAKLLLDCERRTLAHVPSHPNIIRCFSEYQAPIPEHMREHTMADMQTAALDPAHETQVWPVSLRIRVVWGSVACSLS